MPLPAPLTHQPPLWVWFLVGTFELVIRLVDLGGRWESLCALIQRHTNW